VTIVKIKRFGSTRLAAARDPEPDGLEAFASEDMAGGEPAQPDGGAAAASPSNFHGTRAATVLKWVLVISVSASAAAAGMWGWQRRGAPAPSQLTIETAPAGFEVTIGGELRGRTPVTLNLAPGSYEVEIGSGAQRRVIQSTLGPGNRLVERLEMAPAALTGSLRVETVPANLPVFLDGVPQGSSPVIIEKVAPGEHDIRVGEAGSLMERTVTVRPNETMSLILTATARPAGTGGWLAVTSPLALQVREGGRVIGSTDMDRLMLPAGEHVLELVNEALGYRAQRRVSIEPGRTVRLTIVPPQATLSINAQPWAEVWLDGQPLGQTPIGNFAAPIGSYELLFRHPELGERRVPVTIGLTQSNRVGVDMRER
jgi:hypothetical protein